MLSVMNLDEKTIGRVAKLADLNVEISRNGAGIIDFKMVGEIKPDELTLGDKLILASGIEYNPKTGDINIRQYDGKTSGDVVIANLDGIFLGAEPFRSEDVVMLSVILEDGSKRYVERHEMVIKYFDMFSDSGKLLPEFVGKVKAIYEEELQKEIKGELNKRAELLSIEEGRYFTVEDEQLNHVSLDYRREKALVKQLKDLAYGIPLPKAPDFESDLGLIPIQGPSLWDNVLPLGVDPLTGLTSFFHVKNTKKEGDALVGVVVELCRITTRLTRAENVMVYEIEDGNEVVLTPEMLRKVLVGKRYRFAELKGNIGYTFNERARELLRGATKVYVKALCERLGKVS